MGISKQRMRCNLRGFEMCATFSKKFNYILLFGVSLWFCEKWVTRLCRGHWDALLKVSHAHFVERCTEDPDIRWKKEELPD